MRIVNREEFLSLEDPVLYVKCDEYGNTSGELSVSYGRSSKGSEDFVTLPLHGWIKKWGSGHSPNDSGELFDLLSDVIKNRDLHFEWDYTATSRDGLYDKDQLFMIYEQIDLLKLMRMLDKIYTYQFNKDEYDSKYYDEY